MGAINFVEFQCRISAVALLALDLLTLIGQPFFILLSEFHGLNLWQKPIFDIEFYSALFFVFDFSIDYR